MNDTTETATTATRESIAATFEHLAAVVRRGNSEDVRYVADMAETAARRADILTRAIEREEYFECDTCGSDFHTETQRGGRECREMENAN